MTINAAIALNNDAVKLLVNNGDPREALSMLTTSLGSLKSMIQTLHTNPLRKLQQSFSHCIAIVESESLLSRYDTQTAQGEDVETAFLFDRLLFIESIHEDPSQQSYEAMKLCVTCVVFNLALLHQLLSLAMIPSPNRNTYQTKASRLYHTCGMLLDKLASRQQDCHNDVAILLRVASLNNSANISYQLQHYNEASSNLHVASSIIKVHGGALDAYLSFREIQGIMANLYFLQPPTTAHAA